jgi:hypothetical protein
MRSIYAKNGLRELEESIPFFVAYGLIVPMIAYRVTRDRIREGSHENTVGQSGHPDEQSDARER